MDHIPVSFDYKGKHYEGELSQVNGAGAHVYHLKIDRRFYGSLIYTTKWVFHNQKDEMKEFAKYFGNCVSGNHKQKED